MGERSDGLGLPLETSERGGIRAEMRGKHLDRDVPVELEVPGPVDLAHAARAQAAEDLVGAQSRLRLKRLARRFSLFESGRQKAGRRRFVRVEKRVDFLPELQILPACF